MAHDRCLLRTEAQNKFREITLIILNDVCGDANATNTSVEADVGGLRYGSKTGTKSLNEKTCRTKTKTDKGKAGKATSRTTNELQKNLKD
jgi:hypothetical protein